MKKNVTIVTHGGPSHMDDLMAVAILVGHLMPTESELYGDDLRISLLRRDPSPEELNDPSVYVIDVGGRHEPYLLNFDHHQFARDEAPCCALTLVLEHLGLLEAVREAFPWLSAVEYLDSRGPTAWAKSKGIKWDDVADAMASPITGWALERFVHHNNNSPIIKWAHEGEHSVSQLGLLLWSLGRFVLDKMQAHIVRQQELADSKILNVGGLVVVDATHIPREQKPAFGLDVWTNKNAADTAVTITQDDRGDGLCLSRRDDHPAVDFSKIEGRLGVVFAHKNGFVAKIEAGVDPLPLIEAATSAS